MNEIEEIHKKELKKAYNRIIRELNYIIQANIQIELDKIYDELRNSEDTDNKEGI